MTAALPPGPQSLMTAVLTLSKEPRRPIQEEEHLSEHWRLFKVGLLICLLPSKQAV